MSLKQWLSLSNCQHYHSKFVENGVTYDLVPELDTNSLRELGVHRVGDRLRLEIAIAQIKEERLRETLSVEDLYRLVEVNLNREELRKEVQTSDLRSAVAVPERDAKVITLILQTGATKRMNVTGCFNAQSIKRKALKKLGIKPAETPYDAYIHARDKNFAIVSLFDVELVTICYSPERVEKHRIMLCPQGERPSEAAQATSRKIMMRHEPQTDERPMLRNFFGQRPPSELISSNLAEYFPDTNQRQLAETVRNSVRYSVRLSRRFPVLGDSSSSVNRRVSAVSSLRSGMHARSTSMSSLARNRTIGEVMVNNITAIDEVCKGDTASVLSGKSSHRVSLTAGAKRHSRIELLSVSDSEDEDEDYSSYDMLFDEGPRNWLKGARIGAGSFGTVYLGMDPHTGELMAVKQVELTKNGDSRVMLAQQREMMFMKALNHENVVRYFGATTDDHHLNIFLEYVPGGSVQSMLSSYGPFEEPLIRNFVRQVLIGLAYLHGEDIIHRDIKGANILIDIKGTVKIGDFGISKKAGVEDDGDELKSRRRASLQGSVYWMAPEVVKQTAYTKKADIWSVGCLIIEMFTGQHPFPELSQMQAIFKIGTHITPQIPDWCTLEAREFLNKTFEIDYERRPDARDMLGEEFLTPLIGRSKRSDQTEKESDNHETEKQETEQETKQETKQETEKQETEKQETGKVDTKHETDTSEALSENPTDNLTESEEEREEKEEVVVEKEE